MAQNVYECMFILDTNKYGRDPNGVSGDIPAIIEKLEGEVLANRLWAEQKLAYPIDGHRRGTYWLTYCRLESTRIPEFNRACHLNGNILRQLVLKVEPRLVDVLVAHARGESVDDSPEEAAAESEQAESEKKGAGEGEAVTASEESQG